MGATNIRDRKSIRDLQTGAVIDMYKPMFPKQNKKEKSGFRNEKEFDTCLAKVIKEDRAVLIELGQN